MKKLLFLILLIPSLVSAQETISNGLTLTIPSIGTSDWGTLFKDDFAEPISSHDHTGGGKGLQLGASSLTANALNGTSFRLNNDQYLRARNAANSADLDLVKASASNKVLFDINNIDAATRASLGLAIGTNIQAYDADLSAIGALTATDNNFIVGNGATWVAESGATARSSLGLGSIATQASSAVSITGGSVTGITDLAIADGGTGASDASTARSNLGAAASGANSDITSLTGLTWSTWSVTLSGDGTNTLGSTSVAVSRYAQIGKTVHFVLEFTGTLSGVVGASVGATLPIAAANSSAVFATNFNFLGNLQTGTATTVSASFLKISSLTGTGLSNGTYTWRVSGTYEAA